MDLQQMLFSFIGGLGIFLFGMDFLGEGLKNAAGDNLRSILNAFTSTPIRSIIAGMLVTVLIQSSSATTVLTVGLVSAGFLSLKQAIGIVMGANIGTTMTAFIIGFDIGAYALPIIAVGSFIIFFTKKAFINNIGKIIFGFGALFLGLELMGDGMAPLQDMEQFRQIMVTFSDIPLLGVTAGTILTVIIQSSSAMIGILQEMFSQGSMTLGAALPLLFGSNIGSTITAVLASFGASLAAKRTAAAHVIFNSLGTILVLLLLSPFTDLVVLLSETLNLSPAMQLAFAHGIFNVVNVLIQMWFINQIAGLVSKIIPGEEKIIGYDESRLDHSLIKTSPIMALNQVKTELGYMGTVVMDEVKTVFDYFDSRSEEDFERAHELEEVINQMDLKLTEYLMFISSEELPLRSSNEHTTLVEVTKYLERIGDHGEHILMNVKEGNLLARQTLKDGEEMVYLNDADVVIMFNLIAENISEAIEAFTTNSPKLVDKVLEREKEINCREEKIRQKYIDRLNQGIGRPSDGIMFVDIVSSLERMSDHAVKIAKHSIGSRYEFQSNSSSGIRMDNAPLIEE